VVLIEANQNGFDAVLTEVKRLFPEKPIRYLVSTHNHFDHAGSLRAAVADGETIIAQQMDKPLYEAWFSNPRTLPLPDKLAQLQDEAKKKNDKAALAKVTPKFKWVGDKLILKDDTQTLEIYAIDGAIHGEDMLVAYLPKIKTIVEGDAYNPGAPGAVLGANNSGQAAFQKLLASEMDRLKINYDLIVSIHAPGGGDRDVTKADLLKSFGKGD
jgi:glyoxylase-like metal-dependent hydrolase (beta-lactamase superfamily II)